MMFDAVSFFEILKTHNLVTLLVQKPKNTFHHFQCDGIRYEFQILPFLPLVCIDLEIHYYRHLCWYSISMPKSRNVIGFS